MGGSDSKPKKTQKPPIRNNEPGTYRVVNTRPATTYGNYDSQIRASQTIPEENSYVSMSSTTSSINTNMRTPLNATRQPPKLPNETPITPTINENKEYEPPFWATTTIYQRSPTEFPFEEAKTPVQDVSKYPVKSVTGTNENFPTRFTNRATDIGTKNIGPATTYGNYDSQIRASQTIPEENSYVSMSSTTSSINTNMRTPLNATRQPPKLPNETPITPTINENKEHDPPFSATTTEIRFEKAKTPVEYVSTYPVKSVTSTNEIFPSRYTNRRTGNGTKIIGTNKKTEDKFISKKKEVMSLYVNAEFENQICLALDHIKDMQYDVTPIHGAKQKPENEPKPKLTSKIKEPTEIVYFDSTNVLCDQLMKDYETTDKNHLNILHSYGFQKAHCLEALIGCNNDIELCLYQLYNCYVNEGSALPIVDTETATSNSIENLRRLEKNHLESVYKSSFSETVNKWTFQLCLTYLEKGVDHTADASSLFTLDVVLTPKYPFSPPLVLLKCNKFVIPPKNLQISKILFDVSQQFCGRNQPTVQLLLLLLNQQRMECFLGNLPEFVYPDYTCSQKCNTPTEDTKHMTELAKQDRILVSQYSRKMKSPTYIKMLPQRSKLPAWKHKRHILDLIKQHQIVMLKGETGCGKSTQVPQFIFDDWIDTFDRHGQHLEIICTQPRRLSALGVASRVSDERLERVGRTVGYQIRFDHRISDNTRLTFCTIGVLLNRIQREPTLGSVTHVIVDEVHERSAESDFLLLVLKNITKKRQDLKIILMSATMDTNILCDYFNQVPIISIPGRTFPVEQIFLEDFLERTQFKHSINSDSFIPNTQLSDEIPDQNLEDNELSLTQLRIRYKDYSENTCQTLLNMDCSTISYELIVKVLEWIVCGDHNNPKVGTILIFLPGIGEISKTRSELYSHEIFKNENKFAIFILHSSVTSVEQSAIFQKLPKGVSKIILSTNIAETSITIEDCIFVIDSGRIRQKQFDANLNIECLETIWVSKANALQRKGRAGRVRPGVCIHLYTKHRYEHNFLDYPVSEINRIPLESLILYMKVLINYDYKDIGEVFGDFIECPPQNNIRRTLMNLKRDKVIDDNEELTPMGYHLASLPLDVKIGKLLLYGVIFDCVDAALTMAAYLSHKSPFLSSNKIDKKMLTEKKLQLAQGYSDPLTIFHVYKDFTYINNKDTEAAIAYLKENFLSYQTIDEIKQIRYQLLQYLIKLGFVIINSHVNPRSKHDNIRSITGSQYNRNEENNHLLSSILCAAFYPNVTSVYSGSKYPSFCVLSPEQIDVTSSGDDQQKVFMDPKSVNFGRKDFPTSHLVFYLQEKRNNKQYFQDSTAVSVASLLLFANCDLQINEGQSYILMDRFVQLHTKTYKAALLIKAVKEKLFYLINEICKSPAQGLQHQELGKKVIETVEAMVVLKLWNE